MKQKEIRRQRNLACTCKSVPFIRVYVRHSLIYLTVICVENRVIGNNTETKLKSLILAQNERWRQASYMQVERPFGGVADG